MYLTEYDNVDRRIIYSEQICSGSGVELVPMTVKEYNYNSEWIIASTGNKQSDSAFQYWIIKNSFNDQPDVDEIKVNLRGPLDFKSFENEILKSNIKLVLRKID